jgi:hypothetical protein
MTMTNDIRYGGLLGLPRQTSPDGTGGILGQFFAQPAEEPRRRSVRFQCGLAELQVGW